MTEFHEIGARPRVYLAGPAVFRPDALVVGAAMKATLAQYGLEGVFPLDGTITIHEGASRQDYAAAIYRANIGLIASCDATIADMTPFRGVSMDVGTAFEMGVTVGLSIASPGDMPVFAYTTDVRSYAERFAHGTIPYQRAALGTHHWPYILRRDGDKLIDGHEWDVENFDLPDNLMVAVPAREWGDAAKHAHDKAGGDGLAGGIGVDFLTAVRQAAAWFEAHGPRPRQRNE